MMAANGMAWFQALKRSSGNPHGFINKIDATSVTVYQITKGLTHMIKSKLKIHTKGHNENIYI